jgi:hypothetical protein
MARSEMKRALISEKSLLMMLRQLSSGITTNLNCSSLMAHASMLGGLQPKNLIAPYCIHLKLLTIKDPTNAT